MGFFGDAPGGFLQENNHPHILGSWAVKRPLTKWSNGIKLTVREV